MASVVFVKHTMTFLSLLQPPTTHLWTVLFSTNGKKNEVKTVMSRLTLFPSLVAEIEARYINSLQGEEPENEINCFMQKERGPQERGFLSLLRERTLGTRLIAVYKDRKEPVNEINCCVQGDRRPWERSLGLSIVRERILEKVLRESEICSTDKQRRQKCPHQLSVSQRF